MRRRIQMVFQDPYSSLDPRLTVAEALGEVLVVHRLHGDGPASARGSRTAGPGRAGAGFADRYPARAVRRAAPARRHRPGPRRAATVLLLDEPVSALDVSVRAEIMNLLVDLRGGSG